jgi:mannosyl-oligosaccharide alpha-1,2-mannosidase
MYADQPSGLGAEIVLFDGNTPGESNPVVDYEQEKWTWHLEKWEKSGKPGGKPPGVGNAGPPLTDNENVKMDYTLWTSSYLLRPEVSCFKLVTSIGTHSTIDIRVHVFVVPRNWGC